MQKYKLVIDTDALQDIQETTDWYNQQFRGLGTRFQKQVKSQMNMLKTNPHSYTMRYADVRCMLVKKFPFLIHFVINEPELIVAVYSVIHTSRNPKIWEQRRQL